VRPLALLLVLIAACGGGDPAPIIAPTGPGDLFVQMDVGPAGGTIEVTDPAAYDFGVRVAIPAGALAQTESITLTRVDDPGLPPQFLVYEVGPADAVLSASVQVTVKYGDDFVADFGIDRFDRLAVAHDGALLPPVAVDEAASLVTADTATLGRFVVGSFDHGIAIVSAGAVHRAFFQPRVLDTELPVDDRFVERVSALDGTGSSTVGQGSRAAFWNGSNGLILVHGLTGDGTTFEGAEDLVASLGAAFDDILVYQYPSGRPIAENANWLFNEIASNAGPSFGALIIAHSMGGLVSRYCLEKSAGDAARQALPNHDATAPDSIAGLVTDLVTLGTPNRGASIGDFAGVALQGAPDATELALSIPGVRDLQDNADGVAFALNQGFVRPAGTAYVFVAGKLCILSICLTSDGLVEEDSALGSPDLDGEAATRTFEESHTGLHQGAASNGVADYLLVELGKR
jgi:pimeloyl-ACP methyl ester carboxylesterase